VLKLTILRTREQLINIAHVKKKVPFFNEKDCANFIPLKQCPENHRGLQVRSFYVGRMHILKATPLEPTIRPSLPLGSKDLLFSSSNRAAHIQVFHTAASPIIIWAENILIGRFTSTSLDSRIRFNKVFSGYQPR
jgi:hypothetical protein